MTKRVATIIRITIRFANDEITSATTTHKMNTHTHESKKERNTESLNYANGLKFTHLHKLPLVCTVYINNHLQLNYYLMSIYTCRCGSFTISYQPTRSVCRFVCFGYSSFFRLFLLLYAQFSMGSGVWTIYAFFILLDAFFSLFFHLFLLTLIWKWRLQWHHDTL